MMAGVKSARWQARPRRRWPALLIAAIIGVPWALILPAAPASAHAVLTSTNPAQGSVVAEPPTEVVLTFTEGVSPITGRVKVIAPDGRRADAGEPRAAGTELIIPLAPGGPEGTYLVTFRVVSSDSHPVTGSFTYSVGAPSTPPTADGADVSSSGFVTVAFPVVRWIGYLGLVLVVGAAVMLTLLWPQRLDRRRPAQVAWVGAAMVALATVGELLLQVPYVSGGFGRAAVQEVLASQFGAAHLVRLGVVGAATVLLRPVVRGRGWGADGVLLAVLATIGIATWSVSGHPSGSPVPMVTVVADMIHLASMSVWVGGLVMLALFLLPRATATELGAIVPVWSRWATYAVATLLLTGVAQTLVQVGGVDALLSTRYGWTVIAKVSLVAVVLAVAVLSRRLVAPIAAGSDTAPRRLRRIVIAEAGVTALVLAVTSVLVQTTPARTAVAQATGPSVQSAVLRDPLFTLTVDVQPATVGLNEVHVYASTPDGQPADVKEWRIRAALPEQGIEPIDVTILPVTPDHAIGQVGLPVAGTWTFTFTVRTSEIDQSSVATTIVVR